MEIPLHEFEHRRRSSATQTTDYSSGGPPPSSVSRSTVHACRANGGDDVAEIYYVTTASTADESVELPPELAAERLGTARVSVGRPGSPTFGNKAEGKPRRGGPKKRRAPCGVTRMVIVLLMCIIAIVASVVAWKYGPWHRGSAAKANNAGDEYSEYTKCDPANGGGGGRRCCNGLEDLCHVPLHEAMFATVHNAMSSSEDGFVAANNRRQLEDALEAGYRAFMLDTCLCGDKGLQLCHSVCQGGTRDPLEVLQNVASFMVAHPTEVIILEFQLHDRLMQSLHSLYNVMEGANLTDLIYVHDGSWLSDWPLLGDLVRDNKRLIIFHHNGADCSKESNDCPPGFHSWHKFAFETPFSLIGADSLQEYNKSCSVQMGSPRAKFFVSNHFATSVARLPEKGIADIVNEKSFVERRIEACTEKVGKHPNFIVVDFWSVGDVPLVTQRYNRALGLEYATYAPSITPSSSPPISSMPSHSPPNRIPTPMPSYPMPTASPTTGPSAPPRSSSNEAASLLPTAINETSKPTESSNLREDVDPLMDPTGFSTPAPSAETTTSTSYVTDTPSAGPATHAPTQGSYSPTAGTGLVISKKSTLPPSTDGVGTTGVPTADFSTPVPSSVATKDSISLDGNIFEVPTPAPSSELTDDPTEWQ